MNKKLPISILGTGQCKFSTVPFVASANLRPAGTFLIVINKNTSISEKNDYFFEIHVSEQLEDFLNREDASSQIEILLHYKRKEIAEEMFQQLGHNVSQMDEASPNVRDFRDSLSLASALATYFDLGPEETVRTFESCVLNHYADAHNRQSLPEIIGNTARMAIDHRRDKSAFRKAWKEYAAKIAFSTRSELTSALDVCFEHLWEASHEVA